MIYFDNAATSRPKPEVVYDAFNYYVREIGTSPGRGSYGLAVQATRMLYQARKTVAAFFAVNDSSNVVFTKNSTEAINLFFNGFLSDRAHVLISPYEHNAVLRPLHFLKKRGIIDYTVLPEELLYNETPRLADYIRPSTKIIALTLASNLTGQLVFSKRLADEARLYNLTVFVDASQGGGKQIVDMVRDGIDVLAFTGHKDILAMPGVGGLVSQKALNITPLLQGGTGIHGESYINPDAFPDAYEAGTLNMPAIWSLKCAMDYIAKHGLEMREKENALIQHLIDGLRKNNKVELYRTERQRVSTICFNIKGVASSDVVRYLDAHGICVRGGIHCAILAHETLGTVKTGAVRASINSFNTFHEIDEFIGAIEAI